MSDTPAPAAPAPATSTPNIQGDFATAPVGKDKGPGKYKVKVIRSKCIGAASCVAIAPKVFVLDGTNLAYVISEEELDETKLLAAQSCPTSAIEIEDISTGEKVWPK